jgi:hypothetical protein
MLDPVDVLLLEQSGFHLVERNQVNTADEYEQSQRLSKGMRIPYVRSRSWDVIDYPSIDLRLLTFRIVQGVFTRRSCVKTGPDIGSDGELKRMTQALSNIQRDKS